MTSFANQLRSVNPLQITLICTGCYLLFSFVVRTVKWLLRVRRYRKFMPVEAVLFPNTSILRLLWPQKWQRFHRDWHMRYGWDIYRKNNSDIFALVSLFEKDKIFVAGPEMFVELKVTGSDRFQIDTMEAAKVYCFRVVIIYGRLMCMDPIWLGSLGRNGDDIEGLRRRPFLRRRSLW